LPGLPIPAIFPAFLGYILWNLAVADVGAARAGLFMHLLPAFTIVLSMMLPR
jgi:drug/metabolite transporter (DMT)-like permease